MTLTSLISRARRLSRTGSSSPDSVVTELLNDAMRQCVVDCGGIVDVATGTAKGSFIEAPSLFFVISSIMLNNRKLARGTIDLLAEDNSISGSPSSFYVNNGKIHLDKTIAEPGLPYKLIFERYPEPLATAEDAPELPEQLHIAVAYMAAAKMAEENFEYDQAKQLYANYRNETRRFNIDKANSNPAIFGNR